MEKEEKNTTGGYLSLTESQKRKRDTDHCYACGQLTPRAKRRRFYNMMVKSGFAKAFIQMEMAKLDRK